jgi:hypothetical protein
MVAMRFSVPKIVRTGYSAFRALPFAHLLSHRPAKRRRSNARREAVSTCAVDEAARAGEIEGRQAERDRWAEIFADPAALANSTMAVAIATHTSWSPKRVIRFLNSLPARRSRPSLSERMAAEGTPRIGPGDCGEGGPPGAAASWSRAAAPFMPAAGGAAK